MEEINLPEEIQRKEALYKHYSKLYHRVRCSNQARIAKEQKDYYKDLLQKAIQKGI